MLRNVFLFGLLFLASLTVPAAAADLEAEMRKHLAWIGAHTDYDADVPLPNVEYLSRDQMQIVYHGPERIAEAELNDYTLSEVEAIYDHRSQTMVLRDDFDPAVNGDTLVHELVHHLQYVHGDHEGTCPGLLEPEAYRIQEEWMDATGHPGERPDRMMVLLISMSCRNPHW